MEQVLAVDQRSCEPLGKWREVHVSETKTACDWPRYIKWLVDHPRFSNVTRITLVCDNLNRHALYATFDAEEAFRIMSRLEIVNTSKHGSWLNMAEPELSVMTRQCFSHRVGSQTEADNGVDAWYTDRKQRQFGIDGQFTN